MQKEILLDLTIRLPLPSDAGPLLEYLKIIGGESDHLTFGPEGHPNTIAQEEAYLATINQENNKVMLLGVINQEIIATGSLAGSTRPRLRHTLELGLSVKKAYWNMGVGTALLTALIDSAKRYQHVTQIVLHVVQDNEAAIHLYRKFGFIQQGIFPRQIRIDHKYKDSVFMVLPL